MGKKLCHEGIFFMVCLIYAEKGTFYSLWVSVFPFERNVSMKKG